MQIITSEVIIQKHGVQHANLLVAKLALLARWLAEMSFDETVNTLSRFYRNAIPITTFQYTPWLLLS